MQELTPIQLTATPAIIKFPEFDKIMAEAKRLAEMVEQVTVNPDNLQEVKKLSTAVNKQVKALNDRRISAKKEALLQYEEVAKQIKEIEAVTQTANRAMTAQVRQLEEDERDRKRDKLSFIFQKRLENYPGLLVTFEDFLEPSMLNKSTSLNKTEEAMAQWFQRVKQDMAVIDRMEHSAEILAEYQATKCNLTASIERVETRHDIIRANQGKRTKAEALQNARNVTKAKLVTFQVADFDAPMVQNWLIANGITFKQVS